MTGTPFWPNGGNVEAQTVTEQDTSTVEVDLSELDLTPEDVAMPAEESVDVAAEEGVEQPSESAEPQPAVAEPSESPEVQALRAELRELQRRQDERWQQVEPIARHQQQFPESERRFQELREKMLQNQMSRAEFAEYQDLREQRLVAHLRGTAWREANQASSEQFARGLFTEQAMGKGRDFDSLVQRHIRPLYERQPSLQAIRALVPEQPALADYLWAANGELLAQVGNDPVAAARLILDAANAKTTVAADLQKKVRRVEASGAHNIHGADTTVSAATKKKESNFWNWDDKSFGKLADRHLLDG